MRKLILMLGLALVVGSIAAQAPNPDGERIQSLLKDVQTQQTQLAANQAKIDEKLAAVAESIRVARIYASRGGR